jgi:hypothetical protein
MIGGHGVACFVKGRRDQSSLPSRRPWLAASGHGRFARMRNGSDVRSTAILALKADIEHLADDLPFGSGLLPPW